MVRVLAYHSLLPSTGDTMGVAGDMFRRQLEWLHREGWDCLALADWLGMVVGRRLPARRSVVLTFDDGYADNLEIGAPILAELGWTATVFAVTDGLEDGRLREYGELLPLPDASKPRRSLTWDEAEEWCRRGFALGSHTRSHCRLTQCDPGQRRSELEESAALLRRRLGIEQPLLCYPYGDVDHRVVAAARAAGYRGGVVTPRLAGIPATPWTMHRVGIYGHDDLRQFRFKLGRHFPSLREARLVMRGRRARFGAALRRTACAPRISPATLRTEPRDARWKPALNSNQETKLDSSQDAFVQPGQRSGKPGGEEMLRADRSKPRALVVGSWPHVPGHLTSGSAAALEARGYEVAVHDPLCSGDSLAFKLANRTRLRVPAVRAALRPWQNRRLRRAARAFEPELVLVIRGEMITARTIRALSSAGARTVNWCPDDPYQRGTELEAAAAYDHLFVFDPHYIKALREIAGREAHYLSMACDPGVQRPLDLSAEDRDHYGAQVVFVGSHYPNREAALLQLSDFDLAIWGGGWKIPLVRPGHPLRPFYRGLAMGEEMVKIYSASQIVLNVQHPQSVHAQNMRTFEAPACGALTITPYTDELPHLFDVEREIVAYRTIDELIEQTRYYLAHPDEAAAIAEAGRRRAARDHSYLARMKQLLEVVEGAGRAAA